MEEKSCYQSQEKHLLLKWLELGFVYEKVVKLIDLQLLQHLLLPVVLLRTVNLVEYMVFNGDGLDTNVDISDTKLFKLKKKPPSPPGNQNKTSLKSLTDIKSLK